jgi:transposase
VQRSWDRHDRLSVITGITVSPQRQHLGLCFRIHDRHISFEQVVEFLSLLRRQLRRKFILVLDRYSAHRKVVRLLQQAHLDWFEVEWLPAYAPELNPVEMVWNHSKYGVLADFLAGDAEDLREAVTASLEDTGQQPSLLRSFFRYAALQL